MAVIKYKTVALPEKLQNDFNSKTCEVTAPVQLPWFWSSHLERKLWAEFLRQLHENSKRVCNSCLGLRVACDKQQSVHGPLDTVLQGCPVSAYKLIPPDTLPNGLFADLIAGFASGCYFKSRNVTKR